MSCFWNGILKQLRIHRKDLPLLFQPVPSNATELVIFFKKNNIDATNVEVNGMRLTENQVKENRNAVQVGYRAEDVDKGTLVSTFDPILILLCQLTRMDICHMYMKNMVTYKYINEENGEETRKNVPVLEFHSNRGHFW